MGLVGPGKTIIVAPVERPAPEPQRELEPEREPVTVPDKELVPA